MSLSKALIETERSLHVLANSAYASHAQRFFKTGKGEYGEGDVFIGIRVPALRKLARTLGKTLSITDLRTLLRSDIHEERLFALIVMTDRYKKATPGERHDLHTLYLTSTRFVNNWDLVDTSAETLVGSHVANDPLPLLTRLTKSSLLWDRRIAMIATFHLIKQGDATTAITIAELLLHDKEDLIQKAVGWMLREVGKRVSKTALTDFLEKHATTMPRTALRYAIEHFSKEVRQRYLTLTT